MRRTVLLIMMMVALSMVVFAPVAVAQDDNPSADDRGGAEDRGMAERGFDDNGGGVRTFDDNPTGDDATATATATATAGAGRDDDATTKRRLPSAGVCRTRGAFLCCQGLLGSCFWSVVGLRRQCYCAEPPDPREPLPGKRCFPCFRPGPYT
jgi:hypothetical protein